MGGAILQKVLLVDDEPDILELLRYNLEREGLKVFTASNGRDGLKMAKSERPDLIVLDIMMPGMSGFEVCQRLKEDESTALIPVVLWAVWKATQRVHAKLHGSGSPH